MLTSIAVLFIVAGLIVACSAGWTVANRVEDLEEKIAMLESQNTEFDGKLRTLKNYRIVIAGSMTYKEACLNCEGDLKQIDNTDERDVFECVDCKTCYQNRNLWDEPHWEELE